MSTLQGTAALRHTAAGAPAGTVPGTLGREAPPLCVGFSSPGGNDETLRSSHPYQDVLQRSPAPVLGTLTDSVQPDDTRTRPCRALRPDVIREPAAFGAQLQTLSCALKSTRIPCCPSPQRDFEEPLLTMAAHEAFAFPGGARPGPPRTQLHGSRGRGPSTAVLQGPPENVPAEPGPGARVRNVPLLLSALAGSRLPGRYRVPWGGRVCMYVCMCARARVCPGVGGETPAREAQIRKHSF